MSIGNLLCVSATIVLLACNCVSASPSKSTVQDEISELSRNHADLRSAPKSVHDKQYTSTLRMALQFALADVNWQEKELRQRFPVLVKEIGVIGLAGENSKSARVIFQVRQFDWIVMSGRDKDGAISWKIFQGEIAGYSPKLEKANGKDFLVMHRLRRPDSEQAFLEQVYYLIAENEFIEQRTVITQLKPSGRKTGHK